MFFPLLPLVLGAFAIGTETFMISGVLPAMSADLNVSPAAIGALVTIFALAYALGSPLLAIVTAGIERKRLLIGAMGAFALANFLAALSPGFAWLAGARIVLALTAGTFMPAATAFAAGAHGPATRGRALALVYAGMTLATVVGVPLGTWVASAANWRATFGGVGLLALCAVVGVAAFLPRQAGIATVGLKARIAIARRPAVLSMLALTCITLIGQFAANTYLGAYLGATLGITGERLALVLMLFGFVGFLGSQFGGYAADRWNRERLIAIILAVVAVAFALLSIGAQLDGPWRAAAIFTGIGLWGLFGWSFPIAQQARLVSLEPALAPITLSLNTSALYFGAAAGSAIGGIAIRQSSVASIGWIGAVSEIAALALLLATMTKARAPRDAEACANAAPIPAP